MGSVFGTELPPVRIRAGLSTHIHIIKHINANLTYLLEEANQQMTDNYLAKRPIYRKLKNETNGRVSPDAVEEVVTFLEHKIEQIAEDAETAANHADRKTIKSEDIEFVLPNTEYKEEDN